MKENEKFTKIFKNVQCIETIMKKFQKMSTEEEDWKKLIKSF
jgi:hypothetical protein